MSTRLSRENIDRITQWAEQNLEHVKIEFTGRDVLYTNMGNNITDSLLKSLAFNVLTIVPLLLLMFGSLFAGLVSVVNVGPLVIVIGLMGTSGILLDVGTLMVASLGLGIAVDDTVHLLAHPNIDATVAPMPGRRSPPRWRRSARRHRSPSR